MTLGRSSTVDLRPVGDWPKLLAGPIVRRVEATMAHVFVATKTGGTARLIVREGTHDHTALSSSSGGTATPLRQIGAHLFVAVIAAPLDGSPGATYSYDVEFDWDDAGPERLNALGLLGNPIETTPTVEELVPLGYKQNRCPSFLSPPRAAEEVRIAHASCRKPHGALGAREADALPILDQIVHHSLEQDRLPPTNESGNTAPYATSPKDLNEVWVDRLDQTLDSLPEVPAEDVRERPHQLILTGDQIYADDVAPAMLDALTDAGDKLMGWVEEPPGISWGINGFLVQPGWRTRYLSMANIKELPADGYPDYSQSHLLKFGEWCAMYLFAWSPALWPRDGNVLGVRSSRYRVPIAEAVKAVDIASKIATLNASLAGLLKRYSGITTAMSIANRLDDFDEALATLWDSTLDQCGTFASTVPYVRRLLANVATYTMFDDHEITDDWFINAKVTDGLLGLRVDPDAADPEDPDDVWQERVGPRMLRNGLSAYAIFQHWGNVPDDFSSGGSPGEQLLAMWEPDPVSLRPELADRHSALTTDIPWWLAPALPDPDTTPDPGGWVTELPDEITYDDLVALSGALDPNLDNAHSLLRIDQRPPPNGQYDPGISPADREGFNRFRWDYTITFDSHRLIALDTRTWRTFPESVDSAFGFGGSPPGADPADATMAVIRSVGDVLENTSSVPCRAYGALLQAACDVASAASTTSVSFALAFCDAVEDVVSAAAVFAPGSSDLAAMALDPIDGFRLDFQSSADFDPRPLIETSADRAWRCCVLLEVIEAEIRPLSGDLVLGEILHVLATTRRYLRSLLSADPRDAGSDAGFIHAATAESHIVAQNIGVMNENPDSAFWLVDPVESGEVASAMVGASLDLEALVVPPDERSFRFFRDGTDYLAVELISKTALEFQLEHPLAASGGDHIATILLSPAPIFGNELVETVQDAKFLNATRKGNAALEEWDYEAWSANPIGVNNLMIAGRDLRECIVLSGDVHYANSSMNVARIRSEGVETSYGQLTSSSSRNADGNTRLGALVDDIEWQRKLDYVVSQFSPVPIFSGALDRPSESNEEFDVEGFGNDPDTAASLWIWLLEEYWEAFPWNLIKFVANKFIQVDDIEEMKKQMDRFRYEAQHASTHQEWIDLRKKWMWDPSIEFVQEALDWAITAPLHSFIAWIDEIGWLLYVTLQHVNEFREDPMLKIFDHYLFSRDVLTQFIHDAYKMFSIDPAYGLDVERYICRDQRDPRFTLYPGRVRYKDPDINKQVTLFAHSTSVQTVGEANVGLVRFLRHPISKRSGFRHELLFFPFPEPEEPDLSEPEIEIGAVETAVRTDWSGTRHEAWFHYTPATSPDGPLGNGPVLA